MNLNVLYRNMNSVHTVLMLPSLQLQLRPIPTLDNHNRRAELLLNS